VTAAVSWVLQVYPALGRRRALALRLTGLRGVDAVGVVTTGESTFPADLLQGLAADLAQVRVDLSQYTETYYFRDADQRASLPSVIGYAGDLVAAGSVSARSDTRLAAAVLEHALRDFSSVLAGHVDGPAESLEEILAAYARAHS
jgi:hypothetical protein